jgi:hypothetical protein
MKHWDGREWHDVDDEAGIDIPVGVSVLAVQTYLGTGMLDPAIHVITCDESQAAIDAAHQRYLQSRTVDDRFDSDSDD